ncbi:unnamed protein product [Haemonchus placei]|uniref:SAC domain-containing protein n=1 Tax=Haemonchus placei TaxID=6290 RepID=A0A158QPF7_HAEPC|nr:unnamed protein product [Haemonchus placei]
MKLYSTLTAYIVEDDGYRLICSKIDGKLSVDSKADIIPMDAEEICDIISVIGRLDIDGTNYLLFVSESTVVAEFIQLDKKSSVYRIDRVKAIPLDSNVPLDIAATTAPLPSEAAATRRNSPKSGVLLDEVLRLFNDHPDFYFCFGRDITHTTHRHFSSSGSDPDERFFWNKVLLKDLLEETVDKDLAKRWIVPVTQGSVLCDILTVGDDPESPALLKITLISRRSVHRAGVRYLRRGIDCESNVANFVETELILDIFGHHLSFVQVRGSVPIFWSQKGFKYRPPLTVDKNLDESVPYFTTHMQELLDRYGAPLVAVNLVDQAGRELKLATSFIEVRLFLYNAVKVLVFIVFLASRIGPKQYATIRFPHAVKMDCPDLYLVSFDLHRHCRGLKFDKINNLIGKLEELLTQIGYCWVDKTGEIVKTQKGIVRTNCVDCLDRTNVVQGAISQWVCMRQAQRLGLFGPLCEPPEALVTLLQNMWADNGDAISTQYAGTAALKGDVTRSGERRLAGIMRDGYTSASRYYLSHVRDSSRQKAINALLDYKDQGSESMVDTDSESEEDENVCRLVAETIHFLLPEGEVVVGGWALCSSQQSADSIDTILLLTRNTLYIAVYDDDFEKLEDLKIVPLENVISIEVGRSSRSGRFYLRLTCVEDSWMWRAGRTRLFNNISVTINLCIGKDVPVQRLERLSLPRSGNTAKRDYSADEDRGGLAAKSDVPEATLIDFEIVDTDCSASKSTANFQDDMSSNNGATFTPQVVDGIHF